MRLEFHGLALLICVASLLFIWHLGKKITQKSGFYLFPAYVVHSYCRMCPVTVKLLSLYRMWLSSLCLIRWFGVSGCFT